MSADKYSPSYPTARMMRSRERLQSEIVKLSRFAINYRNRYRFPRTELLSEMYAMLHAFRHQRPLRINRHRKDIADWRINVRWSLEGENRDQFVSTIVSYRNGIEQDRHEVRKKCEMTLGCDFPQDVMLCAAVKGGAGEVRCGFAEEGSAIQLADRDVLPDDMR